MMFASSSSVSLQLVTPLYSAMHAPPTTKELLLSSADTPLVPQSSIVAAKMAKRHVMAKVILIFYTSYKQW